MKQHDFITLAQVAGLFSIVLLSGCTSITAMTYSPITATANGPSGPVTAKIEVQPHCCPSTALLVTAKSPALESDYQWVKLGLSVPSGPAASKVTGIEVCYEIETSQPGSTYISQTRITEMTTPDRAVVRLDEPTNRTDVGPKCYLTPTSIVANGSLSLNLKVVFGNANDKIMLGGMKLLFGK